MSKNNLFYAVLFTHFAISSPTTEDVTKVFNRAVQNRQQAIVATLLSRLFSDISDSANWDAATALLVNTGDTESIRTLFQRRPAVVDRHLRNYYKVARANQSRDLVNLLVTQRPALVSRSGS